MKKIYSALFATIAVSCLPLMAGAAGTYYNSGSYQNTQSRYGAGAYNNQYASRGYAQQSQNRFGRNQAQNTRIPQYNMNANAENRNMAAAKKTNSSAKEGFFLDAALSHETGFWKFDMKNAGSQLHYDNLAWNVLSANGTYYFNGSTPFQIKAGLRYGVQYDKATMVDDDISNGAFDAQEIVVPVSETEYKLLGYQAAHAMSIGTSKGGNQFGFNAAIGLTDAFTLGKVKMTPSIGYRYFKHKLTTENNYGLSMDVYHKVSEDYQTCVSLVDNEVRCLPFVAYLAEGKPDIIGAYALNDDGSVKVDVLGNLVMEDIPAGYNYLDLGGTFYYEEYGKSHIYETSWAGPYLALDMVYDINPENSFNGGIEIGLPIYDSKGDQPYRIDWQHPVSVEDKGSFGDAIHLGLNANWITAMTDSVSLSLGFTYDFYKVSNAKAITYFNSGYMIDTYNDYLSLCDAEGDPFYGNEDFENMVDAMYDEIDELESNGWKKEFDKEVNSIYKSMGIRIGIVAKF